MLGYIWRCYFYRSFSRLIHCFGFHHAPPNYSMRERQGVLCWCQWCGLRGFMWDKTAQENAAKELNCIRTDA